MEWRDVCSGATGDQAEESDSGILAFRQCPQSRTAAETGLHGLHEPLLPDPSVDLEIDSDLNRTKNGPDGTNSDATTTATDSSPSRCELWGVPIQSICFLNLVAIVWGTQHAVIKSVIDADDIGSGPPSEDVVQNGGAAASGKDTAAYFTLARFGLAALLASLHTPGCSSLVENFKEKFCGVESTMFVDGVDGMGGEELSHVQPDQSVQSAELHRNILMRERQSTKLVWRYGAELGVWMFLGYAFQAIGLETTTASRSGFLLYLNVKFVPFFSYFIFGKSIKLGSWISALVAFAGTTMLLLDNVNADDDKAEEGLDFPITTGDLWCIAAAAASAMFILRMEAASKAVSKSSELNAASLWIVAALSLFWTIGVSWNDTSTVTSAVTPTPRSTFAHSIHQTFERSISIIMTHPLPLIYLSGVTTALANFLQSKGQKDVSAERASIIYAMDPVYGAIFSNILLGETLGVLGVIGALLIAVAAVTNAVLGVGTIVEEDVVSMTSDSSDDSHLWYD